MKLLRDLELLRGLGESGNFAAPRSLLRLVRPQQRPHFLLDAIHPIPRLCRLGLPLLEGRSQSLRSGALSSRLRRELLGMTPDLLQMSASFARRGKESHGGMVSYRIPNIQHTQHKE